MTEQSTDNAHSIEFAGAFAFEAIRNYVNEIRAASDKHASVQVGGAPYIYFNGVLDRAGAIAQGWNSLGSSEKVQIRQLSLNAVREFVEKREAEGFTDDHAYKRFRAKQDVIERLLAGDTPQEVLAALKAEGQQPAEDAPEAGL